MAHIRFSNKFETTFKHVQDNMVYGRAFSMSKVGIDAKSKKQYTHTPIQIVVELGITLFTPLLQSNEHDQ